MNVSALLYIFLVVIIGVVLYYVSRKTRPILSLVIRFPMLIASWYFLFGYFTLTAQRVLAPWDQWGQFAPPPETWERHLNDYFTNPSHARLVSAWIVGISVLIFSIRLLRERDRWTDLPIIFIVTNFGFLLVAFSLIPIVTHLPNFWLSQPRSAVDAGYHRTWIDGAVTVMLMIALYWLQARIKAATCKD